MSIMPEKSLTVATYAAGASLAAITLVYVFGPTFFIDGDPSTASSGSKRKGVVGLTNVANDCFINSVLQSLAGLRELRVYLIRESHRRNLDGREVYRVAPSDIEKLSRPSAIKLEGLQRGIVTLGLKEVLNSLNERPIYKKTISAAGFVEDLEVAFRQKISRQQQDAQEFLQIVAERLCDEYHAGRKARDKWREADRSAQLGDEDKNRYQRGGREISTDSLKTEIDESDTTKALEESVTVAEEQQRAPEEGFPLEGTFESQVECLTCHFKPKSSKSNFVTLTLNVPQRHSATLNECFDGFFQTEYIEDYICDRCRLEHAAEQRQKAITRSRDPGTCSRLEADIRMIKESMEKDPERPPENIKLPERSEVPKRRIARHARITQFPKVLAVHLSRSIFDARSTSLKNSAKVAFPEMLSLGGIVNKKTYKLLGVVTHKGSHNSGHYESFRRQNLYPPFFTPNVFQHGGVYDPLVGPKSTTASPSLRPSSATGTERNASLDTKRSMPISSPSIDDVSTESTTVGETNDKKKKRDGKKQKRDDRWWRISDDRVKECKTGDVLGMRGEVYLLFYEMERQTNMS